LSLSITPFVSIVVLNFNGRAFIKQCLDSVLSSEYQNFEVIVVDNGSTDQSCALLESKYGGNNKVTVIKKEKNYGVPEGRNIGLKQTKGEYVVFLDNDCVVDANWISAFLETFDKDERIVIAQSKILNMVHKNRYDHAGDFLTPFGFLSERSNGAIDQGQFDRVDDIFNAKGAAYMIRRSIIDKVGDYDASYFMYLEETDFCWRVWLAGYRVVFVPKSIVWHAYGTSLKDEKKYYSNFVVRYYGCRNYIITTLKNAGLKRLSMFLAIQIPCFLFLSLLFLLKRKPKDSFFILKALLSIVKDFSTILEKRKIVQNTIRKQSDAKFFKIILKKESPCSFIRKAMCYVSGRYY